MATSPSQPPQPPQAAGGPAGDAAEVVHLNAAADLFAALSVSIRGTATGWSPSALAKLEAGLVERYGGRLGSERAVRKLVELAAGSEAA